MSRAALFRLGRDYKNFNDFGYADSKGYVERGMNMEVKRC